MRSETGLSDKEAEKALVMDRVVKGNERRGRSEASLCEQASRFPAEGGNQSDGHRIPGPWKPAEERQRTLFPKESAKWCGTRERTNTEARAIYISELLERNEDVHISGKSVGRILKESGVKNLHTHKAPKSTEAGRGEEIRRTGAGRRFSFRLAWTGRSVLPSRGD